MHAFYEKRGISIVENYASRIQYMKSVSVTGYQIALGDNDEGRVEIGGGPGQICFRKKKVKMRLFYLF